MAIPQCDLYVTESWELQNKCSRDATHVVVLHNMQIGVWSVLYCDEHFLWAQRNQQENILNKSKVNWILQDKEGGE